MSAPRRLFPPAIQAGLWLLVLLALLTTPAHGGRIHPLVAAAAEAAGEDGTVAVIIHLTDRVPVAQLDRELKTRHAPRAERHRFIIEALQEAAARSQAPVINLLEEGRAAGQVIGYTPYWISNLIIAQVRTTFLASLTARADVDLIELNFRYELRRPVAERRWYGEALRGAEGPGQSETITLRGREIGVTPGLRAINADRCWDELGLSGAGRLVCNIDTGIDSEHPALMTRWRGYGGAHPPEECWLDVLADTVGVPYDVSNHGTHTMGTICGLGEATGDTIGVAWCAQWIATNAIGQPGWNTEFDNDIIACFQWVADPDGNPGTVDDVPDVCQNSWGTYEQPPEISWYDRCTDLWWQVIDNCEAAGVVVTFSAANEGPAAMSIGIPADRNTSPWNSYAVGAIDATNYSYPYPLANFSSRGPSSCDEITIKPEVSAPGVDVVSCIPGGDYAPMSGTSMAGPHVAGVVALMRELDPDLDVDRIKQILMDTAVDHGDPGEDNDYGWGVIDAHAACLAVMHGYGNLVGDVSSSATGAPLAGVRVSVAGMGRVVFSPADGSFDLRHLPADTYSVTAELFGYEPATSDITIMAEGQHYLPLELESHPRATVRGVVNGPLGGIGGVVIDVLDAPVPSTSTGGDGSFWLDLPVRDYELSAGRFGWIAATTAVSLAANETLDVALTLYAGAMDDFEFDQGWTVGALGDSAYEGLWERDDPNATYWGPNIVQPGDDASPAGVQCYVTENQPESASRFYGDVDGGTTSLVSPVFDASGATNPSLIYYRWFHSISGYPHDQPLVVEISNDGGQNWVNVETFTGGNGGWNRIEVPLATLSVAPTDQMRIRFVAIDNAHTTAVVEAAIDDVELTGFFSHAQSEAQPLALSLSIPRPNPLGVGTVIHYTLPRSQHVDMAIYDTAGRLIRRLAQGEHPAGLQRIYWDGRGSAGRPTHSGVYFVRLATENRTLSRRLVVTR